METDEAVPAVHTDPPCALCEHQSAETARRLGVASAGLSAEDFVTMLDEARARGVRTFSLKTTMRGCPVELSASFEAKRRADDED